MKILTLNGKKLASVIFCLLCTAVIVYVGIVNHHTVVVTATIPDTATVGLVVQGFGYGHGGTREFLYSDLLFSAIVSEDSPMYAEEINQIENTGREIISDISKNDLDFQVISITGRSISTVEDSLKRALARSEQGDSIVIIVDLSDNGLYAAQAINNIVKNFGHINFVPLGDFLNIVEQK